MAEARPILYSFRRCPYAIRARLALCQAGVAVTLREVDLKHKPAALLAVSPLATVPVLVVGPGRVLTQSLDIMHWALAQADGAPWLAQGDNATAHALVARTDSAFKPALDRYKYPERHPERSQQAHRDEAVKCLMEPLEAALQAHGHLGHTGPCWADAAVFPFVRQFAAVDAAWWATVPWVATQRWLAHWQASPLFAACMHKYPVWQPGDAPLQFPAQGRVMNPKSAVFQGEPPTLCL
jgi:glutathione S-transferase